MRRLFDVALSAAGLVIFLPVAAAIAAAIVLADHGPILFRQLRVGRSGKPFEILKFRSMIHGRSGMKITAESDQRITCTGRFIRAYKLDELPQLWNVFRGDMSLVGPRPEVPQFVDLDDPVWKKVLSVRPGITGLASLDYRHEERLLSGQSDPEEYYRRMILPAKLDLNLRYIAHRTLWSDLKILLLTVGSSFLPRLFNDNRILKIPIQLQ